MVISSKQIRLLEASNPKGKNTCFQLLTFWPWVSDKCTRSLFPWALQRREGRKFFFVAQILPLEPVGSWAANEKFPRGAFKRALKGCSSDPEAWEKYPVSQATSPTPFWARHPARVKLLPKADLFLRIRKNKFPPTPCNPAPVTAVGLHNLAALLDRANTHPTVSVGALLLTKRLLWPD